MSTIHFIAADKFTDGYISLIRRYFSTERHIFVVYGSIKWISNEVLNDVDVHCYQKPKDILKDKNTKANINQSKKIIMHGLSSLRVLLALWKYSNKVCQVFWGGEIHSIKQKHDTFAEQIKWLIIKSFISRVDAIATLLVGEQDILKMHAKLPRKLLLANYINTPENHEKRAAIRTSIKPQDPYYVLVGNSAAETNKHIEILNALRKYRNNNVSFITPLSYGGNPEYVEKVIAFGYECLGDKFIPIIDYMEYDKYCELINKCQVALFGVERQQAMGNISTLLYLGAKVYIRTDTVMWDEFFIDRKMNIYDIEIIPSMSFQQFVNMSFDDIEDNYVKLNNRDSITIFIERWTAIFKS